MSSYLLSVARNDAHYIAIPAFVSRLFRHSSVYIRTDRIKTPADLKGKTIGLPEYQMTANVWVRGRRRWRACGRSRKPRGLIPGPCCSLRTKGEQCRGRVEERQFRGVADRILSQWCAAALTRQHGLAIVAARETVAADRRSKQRS
jgi:hypothetical protein